MGGWRIKKLTMYLPSSLDYHLRFPVDVLTCVIGGSLPYGTQKVPGGRLHREYV